MKTTKRRYEDYEKEELETLRRNVIEQMTAMDHNGNITISDRDVLREFYMGELKRIEHYLKNRQLKLEL